jgi:hypothetical protein
MAREYEELRIRLWSVGEGRYLVLANGLVRHGGLIHLRDPNSFHNRLDKLLHEDFGRDKDEASIQKRLGELARELRVCFNLESCIERALAGARAENKALRLRFYLPPELSGIPVELLSTGGAVSVARSVGRPSREKPLTFDESPLTVVMAGASPKNYLPRLDTRREIRDLTNALSLAIERGRVIVVPIPNATRKILSSLALELPARTKVVFVVIAHGTHDGGKVVLEDEHANADIVSDDLFAKTITAGTMPCLVSLMMCQGGTSDLRNPLSGVAGKLIGQGVPMVVAFQHKVSDPAAKRLTVELLTQITAGSWLDEACSMGRFMMAERAETGIEGCTPLMFLGENCRTTQLISSGEAARPNNADPIEEALWIVRRSRITKAWADVLNLLESAVYQYHDLRFDPLLTEAWIETEGADVCAVACDRLENGNSAAAKRELVKFVREPGLVDPLLNLEPGKPLENEETRSHTTRPEPQSIWPWDSLLWEVAAKLRAGETVLLYGPEKIGKSWLAQETGKRLGREGYTVIHEKCTGWKARAICAAVNGHPREKTFLILDDVGATDFAAVLRGGAAAILTSRRRDLNHIVPAGHAFEVRGVTENAALELFKLWNPGRDVSAYEAGLKELARRERGMVCALFEANEILKLECRVSDCLERLRIYNAPGERERWRESKRNANKNAAKLLMAARLSDTRGFLASFVADVAGVSTDDLPFALTELVNGSQLECVDRHRQCYRLLESLETREKVEKYPNDGVSEKHYQLVRSPKWIDKRDCMGEVVIAASWRLTRGQEALALLRKAVPTLLRLDKIERETVQPGISESDSRAQPLLRRHLYTEARLCQALGFSRRARKALDAYMASMGTDWADVAMAHERLALNRPDKPEESLMLFDKLIDLCRQYRDHRRHARILGIQASILARTDRLKEAEHKLARRHTILLDNNLLEDQLVAINEEQGDLMRVLDLLSERQAWPTDPGDFDRFTVDSDWVVNQFMRDEGMPDPESEARAWNFAEQHSAVSFMSGTDDDDDGEIADALKLKLIQQGEKALEVLQGQQGELEDDESRWRDLRACYSNQVTILRLMGWHGEALEVLLKCEKLCSDHDYRRGLEDCCRQRVLIYRITKNLSYAQSLDRKAALSRILQFEEAYGYASWDWGLIAALRGDPDESARFYMGRAASIMDSLGESEEKGKIDADIAMLSARSASAASGGRP